MSQISIEEYNRREALARASGCNRLVEAFSPSHFGAFGYPARVADEQELFKFVDVMQERRFDHYFHSVLGALTTEEFQAFSSLAAGVAELCAKRFGRAGCGKSAIAHSINVLRHIQLLTDQQPVRIFEVGPGCGYLGALAVGAGNAYLSYDVTQAFYLYQNRLWSHLYGPRVIELAEGGVSGEQLNRLLSKTGAESQAIHLPWWELMRMPQGNIPTVDVVTCNHVLCEMHHASLSFTAKLSRLMLEGSSGPRLVIFEGWGWHATNRLSTVVTELYKHGFVLVHNDPSITVLALRADATAGMAQDLGNAVDTQGITWHAGKCYVEESVKPFESDSPVARKLRQGREALRAKQTISRDRVREFLVALVGEGGLTTDDERFLDFIEYPV